jgi:hypothetical protein
MQILYKGKSNTYVGECECGTIILAKRSEVELKCYNQAHTYFLAKCLECGEDIIVYEDGSERAKEKRAAAANQLGAEAFLVGLEEEKSLIWKRASSEEAFTDDQTIIAIEQFLEYGEQTFCLDNDKIVTGHGGYFSGGGWAASCLRSH